jgi:glycosyltransferase involved in cell wall biosynthesis
VIRPAEGDGERDLVLYVGRFVPEKKVDVLLRGFEEAYAKNSSIRLALVGDGPGRKSMESLARRLGIREVVEFSGWVADAEELFKLYSRSYCSVSPGFVGLSLTQSAGFGVPMIVSRDEPHSPEIELASEGAVRWFETDVPSSLAQALLDAWQARDALPLRGLSTWVQRHYSAEAMADGLFRALLAVGSPPGGSMPPS